MNSYLDDGDFDDYNSSFIPSGFYIAPLQVHCYSEALPTTY